MDGFDQVYMVRDAAFGSEFDSKLILSLVAVGLVGWDRKSSRRWDYAWVFLTGTAIWTLVELSLQLRGTRVMPQHILFGQEMPLGFSTLLQGMSEGAFVAVLGVFLGDRILRRTTRAQALIALGLVCGLVAFLLVLQAARAGQVSEITASRRAMISAGALALMLAIVLFDLWFWWRRPEYRMRSLLMTGVMIVFASVWTLTSVATGARWVEVGSMTSESWFESAPVAIATVALTYDVVFEIVFAYVPFLAIPALLGLLATSRDIAHPQPEFAQSRSD